MKTKLDINVEWVTDDQPDLSWIGQFVDNLDYKQSYIDRKHDIFVNPATYLTKTFASYEQSRAFHDEVDNMGIIGDEWDEDNGEFTIQYLSYQELPYSCSYGRGEYRYYISCNYPHASESDDIKYFIEDCRQLERYGIDWYERGCIVKASLNGIQLGYASCWGYDSTMSESEDDEVEKELIWEATEDAKKALALMKEAEVE